MFFMSNFLSGSNEKDPANRGRKESRGDLHRLADPTDPPNKFVEAPAFIATTVLSLLDEHLANVKVFPMDG